MFDRWQCWWPKTWSFRIFKKHHTQLNAFYWAHSSGSIYLLKTAKGLQSNAPAANTFPNPPGNSGHHGLDIQEWSDDYKEFMNWVRLSAAVALSGYFEVYLKSAISLALESDPSVMLGVSHAIDGVRLLKSRKDYSYSANSDGVVHGPWQQRLNAYRNLFGEIPDDLLLVSPELEHLRILRNGVGHAFGRGADEYKSQMNFELAPVQRLSEERLKKWLGDVETAALAVDEHLRNDHLGSYEALKYFHIWKRTYKRTNLTQARAFQASIAPKVGNSPNQDYFIDLIGHYQRL
jgi:hypothetical protein